MSSKNREVIGLSAFLVLLIALLIPEASLVWLGVSVILLHIAIGRDFLERWMYPVLGGAMLLGVVLLGRGLMLGQLSFSFLGSVGAPWQSVLGLWLGTVWFLQVVKFAQRLSERNRLWGLRGLFGLTIAWLIVGAVWPEVVGGRFAFGHPLNGFLIVAFLLVAMFQLEKSREWKMASLIILPLLWIFGDVQMATLFAVVGGVLLLKGKVHRWIDGVLMGGSLFLTLALSSSWRELILMPRYAALVRPTWSAMMDVVGGLRGVELWLGTGINSFGETFFRLMPGEILGTAFWSAQFSAGMSVLTTALVQWGLVGVALILVVGGLIGWGAKINWGVGTSLFLICLWWPLSPLGLLAMLFVVAFGGRGGRLETMDVVRDKNQQRFWAGLSLGMGVAAVSLGSSVLYASYLSGQSAKLAESDPNKSLQLLDRALMIGGRDAVLAAQMSAQLLKIAYIELQVEEPSAERISALAEAAVHYAVRATEIDPQAPLGWIQRSNVYLQLLSVAQGAEIFAVASAEEAVSLAPNHPLALMTLARAKMAVASQLKSLMVDGQENTELEGQRQQALVEAREAYQRALVGRPQLSAARLGLSTVEVMAGDQAAALRVIEEGLALMPRDVQMLTQAGLLYSLQGKFDQAGVVLNEALTLAPTAANARWYLSFVEEAQGEREKALETLKILADFVPENEMVVARLEKLSKPLPVPEVVAPPVLTPAPLVDDSVTN
jgi:tetratricopeptide (TPR) repeat protein